MRKKGEKAKWPASALGAWRERLQELGCDPKEQCYHPNYNPLVEDLMAGRKVWVLVDARPHLDGLGPVMTFWPAEGSYRELMLCVAVIG